MMETCPNDPKRVSRLLLPRSWVAPVTPSCAQPRGVPGGPPHESTPGEPP